MQLQPTPVLHYVLAVYIYLPYPVYRLVDGLVWWLDRFCFFCFFFQKKKKNPERREPPDQLSMIWYADNSVTIPMARFFWCLVLLFLSCTLFPKNPKTKPNRQKGLVCALCEATLVDALRRSPQFGNRVATVTLTFLVLGVGMFHASTAFVPSTTAMYVSMVGFAAWLDDNDVSKSPKLL